MIQSAMMFALGIFVSGLLWLALSVALVRRARRLTERRLLASIATRRAEFETERDELRARHAVRDAPAGARGQPRPRHGHRAPPRSRRQGARPGQPPRRAARPARKTSHDMQQRLADERDTRAGPGAAARRGRSGAPGGAARLKLETQAARHRRGGARRGDASWPTSGGIELSALRAQNEALRAALGERLPERRAARRCRRRAIPQRRQAAGARSRPHRASGGAASCRCRCAAASAGRRTRRAVGRARRPSRRATFSASPAKAMATSADGVWRAPAHAEPRMPAASSLGRAGRRRARARRGNGAAAPAAASRGGRRQRTMPETRFFEALAEIRALKRAASQAGE